MQTDSAIADFFAGIGELDGQHGELFRLLDELDYVIGNGDRWHVVHNVLIRITQWAEVHFAVEECLMRIFNDKGAREHAADHAALKRKLKALVVESLTRDVAREAAGFLREWKQRHIAEFDAALMKRLRAAAAGFCAEAVVRAA